jgi:hypothetical protein
MLFGAQGCGYGDDNMWIEMTNEDDAEWRKTEVLRS